MKFLIYILYIFCVFVLGNLRIGPLSFRVYATIMMILYLVHRRQSLIIEGKSYLKLYCLFIFLHGVSLILSGDPGISHYIHDILAYYLVAIVIFISVPNFVTNEADFNSFIKYFSVFLLLDAAVTIFQYRGIYIGWIVSQAVNNYGTFIEDGMSTSADNLLGRSLSIGLFPYAFVNAPFLASGVCLMLSCLVRNLKKYEKIYYILVIVVSTYACFATQQRSAFFALVLFIGLYLWVFSKKTLAIASIIAITGIIVLGWTIDVDSLGRIGEVNNASDEARRMIWKNSIQYIQDHFMFGGPDNCISRYGYPHNFFLAAFIYSGILGAWPVLLLFFKVLVLTIRQMLKSILNKSSNMCVCCAFAVSLSQGMTHNNSMLNGDALLFFVLALLIHLVSINSIEHGYAYTAK